MSMKFLLGFLLIISCITCQDELMPSEPVTGLGICHDEEFWDQKKIADKLLGRWRWIYTTCTDASDEAFFQKFKGLVIEFLPNNTFISTYEGVSPQEGTYNVSSNDGKYYSLKITPEFESMVGRLLFCNDELEFNYSYTGGCNNFFRLTY